MVNIVSILFITKIKQGQTSFSMQKRLKQGQTSFSMQNVKKQGHTSASQTNKPHIGV